MQKRDWEKFADDVVLHALVLTHTAAQQVRSSRTQYKGQVEARQACIKALDAAIVAVENYVKITNRM